tara:strand:- start:4431 stop:5213 length:783 start_codon:yes stop_codon:yes gene_type:complete
MKYRLLIFIIIIITIIIIIKIYYKNKNKNLIKAYVINLDYRLDRKISFCNSYNLKNIEYEIVKAIDKKNIIPDILLANNILGKIGYNNLSLKIRNNHYQFNDVGAIGCYLSHIKTWIKILNDNVKYGIVYEDDVLFNKDITSNLLIKYINNLPNDWNILLLNKNKVTMNKLKNKSDLYKVKKFLCTHSYIIKSDIINYLLENIFPINQQIDFKLSCLATNNILNIYLYNDKKFYKQYKNNTTNIQTDTISNASWELNCNI